MRQFTVHTGVAAPLRRSDVDTDQIIPARFCSGHSREGYRDALFADWRADPHFILNREPWTRATILVAGENFGCGSSREHAVWALQSFGFRAVIAPRFGDIFRANSLLAGLLTLTLPADVVEELCRLLDDRPTHPVSVDLQDREVRTGDRQWSFDLDDAVRERLLAGVDQIGVTLRYADDIAGYERRRRALLPRSDHARITP
ncbi:3-isopropylmalate dehydratase small subunit [Actinoplanes sp. NPDC049548]|uniref:3-isopropylmalate dehydratase small subunit n=1 Tax=Actinoplanes sp. NPDC049548 TaxID=3155152 RepID=UPI00343AA40A